MPEAWRDTVTRVLHQRLAAHEHPDAVADALRAVPRSRPFEAWEELAELDVPALVVASRDEVDPGHPYAVGERYAAEIPGAELRSRGARRVAAGVAGRAALEGDRRAGRARHRLTGSIRAISGSAHSTTVSRS